jgi:hypothetical protein
MAGKILQSNARHHKTLKIRLPPTTTTFILPRGSPAMECSDMPTDGRNVGGAVSDFTVLRRLARLPQ